MGLGLARLLILVGGISLLLIGLAIVAGVGPGDGEPPDATLEPRFRPTDEVFMDPTSGRKMRVWLDPRSGERRYRAET